MKKVIKKILQRAFWWFVIIISLLYWTLFIIYYPVKVYIIEQSTNKPISTNPVHIEYVSGCSCDWRHVFSGESNPSGAIRIPLRELKGVLYNQVGFPGYEINIDGYSYRGRHDIQGLRVEMYVH